MKSRPEFPISQAIYRRLLLAYPRRHRKEYSAAMAQIFRDQCRDAWKESQNLGLLKLWLRVLPDLARTSILERLAALKERKTMTEKLANLSSFRASSPASTFFKVFVPVFLLVVLASVAITYILPESYASTSTILVRRIEAPTNSPSYRSQAVPDQLEVIRSEAVLSNVVTTLNLNNLWSKKYFNGRKLKTAETVNMLRQRLLLSSVKSETPDSLMSITVYDDDKNEAATIANAVVEAYRDSHIFKAEAQESTEQSNAALRAERELDAQVKDLHKKVETLGKQYGISHDATGPRSPEEQPYWDAKQDLAERVAAQDMQLKLLTDLQKNRVAKAFEPGRISNIAIIDRAVPSRLAARPNKPLNIFLGVVLGGFAASAIGAIAAAFVAVIRSRKQKLSATA